MEGLLGLCSLASIGAFVALVVALSRRSRLNAMERRLEELERTVEGLRTSVARIHLDSQSVLRGVQAAGMEPRASAAPTHISHSSRIPVAPIPVATLLDPTPTESRAAPEKSGQWPREAATEPAGPLVAARGMSPPSRAVAPGRKINLEELLGERLFLKLGVAIVVLGMVFFLAHALGEMGPLGKVLTGASVGAAMLGGGFFAERKPRYLIFGRSLIAGGFAVLYFVAFAMHSIAAAKVIDSPVLGAAMLLAVGAAAVGVSLRYRYEWTTAFAFGLALLALFFAAQQPAAPFNFAATTVVGAAVALVSWRLGWTRLLAFGALGTWATVAVWLIPEHGSAPDLAIVLSQIALLWIALQAPIALVRKDPDLRRRWATAALIINLLGAFALALVSLRRSAPHSMDLAATAFGVAYLGQAWIFSRQSRRPLYLLSATIGIACLALATPLRLGFEDRWVPVLRLVGIEVVLAAGIFLRERYFRLLAYLAFALTFVQLLGAESTPVFLLLTSVRFCALAWLLSALLSLANAALLSRWWRAALRDWELPGVLYAFSAAGTLFISVLCLEYRQGDAAAAALGALALAWFALALRTRRLDFQWEAAVFAALAVVEIIDRQQRLRGTSQLGGPASLVAGMTIAGLYAAYWLCLREPAEKDRFSRSLSIIGVGVGALAWAALAIAILAYVPRPWVGAALALSGALHILAAFHTRRPELAALAIGHTLLGGYAVAFISMHIFGPASAASTRAATSVLAMVPMYLSHSAFQRLSKERNEALKWIGVGARGRIELLFLALPTGLLAALIDIEALAHGKNLLVAVAWSALGLLYFELARRLRSWSWAAVGHALLVAATVQLFLVNFTQPGAVGPFSLRLITVLPVLAALAYTYARGRDTLELIAPWFPRALPAYFYASLTVATMLLKYELHRGWVVFGWSLLALAVVIGWRRNRKLHWQVASGLLGIATVARGMAENLYQRDVIASFRINLLVIPLSCAALLVTYFVKRQAELAASDASAAVDKWKWLEWSRTVSFFAAVALFTSHLWIESEGTHLTVFLSLEALFAVALGIGLKERTARVFGLSLLCFCIGKLFIYDMRGLTGIPRIGSFVVLGFVLIAVSYAYTRFRERLKDLL